MPHRIISFKHIHMEDDNMTEIWKSAVNKNGQNIGLDVSNFGNVRYSDTLLQPNIHSDQLGYIYVCTKGETFKIHILVARAFIKNPYPPGTKVHVHHKDHNPSNNNMNNLEFLTPSEHVSEGHLYGSFPYGYSGESNPNNKYDKHTVHRICELLQNGRHTSVEIANLLHVGVDTVRHVLNGQQWTHISKNYDFSKQFRAIRHAREIVEFTETSIINGMRRRDIVPTLINKYNLSKTQAAGMYNNSIKRLIERKVINKPKNANEKHSTEDKLRICRLLQHGGFSISIILQIFLLL